MKVSHFYLEKQKSFITKKKKFKPLSVSRQKTLFTDPIFREGFDSTIFKKKAMSSNPIVFLKWEMKWISPDGFYILN